MDRVSPTFSIADALLLRRLLEAELAEPAPPALDLAECRCRDALERILDAVLCAEPAPPAPGAPDALRGLYGAVALDALRAGAVSRETEQAAARALAAMRRIVGGGRQA